jgi:hypothetical protein
MRRFLSIAIAAVCVAVAGAQGPVIHGNGDPTTNKVNCAFGRFYVDDSTQTLYMAAQGSPCVWGPGTGSPDAGAQVFNVKAYGAKGDNSTNEASAFQAAINAASAAGGGYLFVPAGFYKITSALTWATGVSLRGVSPQLQAIAGQNPDIIMTPIGGSWINCAGVANCITGSSLRSANFEHIGFENATSAALSFGGDGIDGISFSSWVDVAVIGSTTINASDEGIRLNNIQHLALMGINIYNVNTCMDFINQSSIISGSNSEIYSLYCKTYPKSVANGNNAKPAINIRVVQPTIGTAANLNYLHFVRSQVNSYNGDGTGTMVSMTGLNGTSHVNGIVFDDADLEGTPLTGFYADYYSGIKLGVNSLAMSTGGNTTFVLTSNILGGAAIDSQDGGATFSIPAGVTISGRWANATMTNQYGVFIPQTSSLVIGNFSGNLSTSQTVAATSGQAQYSPTLNISGNYWNGSASAPDTFTFQNTVSNGTNPNVNFNVTHAGTSSTAFFNFNGMTVKVGSGGFSVDSSSNVNVGSGIFLSPGSGAANVNEVDARTAANQLTLSPPGATGTPSLSGCSISGQVGGKWAGKFTSGTTGTCTVTITSGITAPNGFSCWANDLTTPADKLNQTATTTTVATIAGTTVTGDVITWGCVSY